MRTSLIDFLSVIVVLIAIPTTLHAQLSLPYFQTFDENANGWLTQNDEWFTDFENGYLYSYEMDNFNAYYNLKSPQISTEDAEEPRVRFKFTLERENAGECAPKLQVNLVDMATGDQEIWTWGASDDFCSTENFSVGPGGIHNGYRDLPISPSLEVRFQAEFYDPGTIYLYEFEVYDAAALGVDDGEWRNTAIFPNPASEHLYIQLPEAAYQVSYRIVDMAGLTVQSGPLMQTQTRVQLNKLPSGIYVLQFVEERAVQFNQKIVIQ